ncbi:MAG TPA: 2-hydroxyacid dehydrogenase [Beijerinckiaceae bacterium]
MKRVLYNSRGDAALYAMIREAAAGRCEVIGLDSDDDAERIEKLKEADAVIVASRPFTRALIEAGRRLAFVHHQGVGYHDTVDTAALAERGIPLAITPGGTTVGVAEHTVMLILAMLRRLPFADAELRQGRFHINALRPVSRELCGRTVGLLGAGRIGRAVAERLKPFGVRLIHFDPAGVPADVERVLGLEPRSFDALLEEADILSLHLPLTAGTRRIVDGPALARMKRGAFLVNTARGGLVDEPALVAALQEGRLAGAALDVFDPEPPRPGNPLYALPNVVLTPHVAAGTRDAFMEKQRFIFDNLARFWAGEPVENLVELSPALDRATPPRTSREPRDGLSEG